MNEQAKLIAFGRAMDADHGLSGRRLALMT
jgi:hypothetical protein